jgi:hypothetical protein
MFLTLFNITISGALFNYGKLRTLVSIVTWLIIGYCV